MKKQIQKDDVQKIIMDNREREMSDKDTYLSLQEQYYDKKTLARIIKTTTTHAKIAQYKPLNILLLVLFISLGVIFIVSCFFNIYENFNSSFFLVAFAFSHATSLAKYDFYSYRVVLGTYIAIALYPFIDYFIYFSPQILTNLQIIVLVTNTVLSILIISLTIYLQRKLFMPKKERKLNIEN